MASKYLAKYVYWDTKKRVVMNVHDIEIYRCNKKLRLPKHIARFDSQHEFKVYLELVRMYGEYSVERQVAVEIIPPCKCYPTGKRWKVDFTVLSPTDYGDEVLYVEAKGFLIPAFADTLAMFEIETPYYLDDFYLVFPQQIPTDKQVIKNLQKSGLNENLLTLNTLKELRQLP